MNAHNSCTIAIVGAGSIGCYLGGCLLAAGVDTLLVGRQRIQKQLNQHGLQVTDWQGRNQRLAFSQIHYTCDISLIEQADYILLTVKSGDTPLTAASILKHARANAIIVSIQNGTKNIDTLKGLLAHHIVVKGMVPFNVSCNDQGSFHCGTEGNLAIEAADNEYLDLIQAFAKADLPINTYPDLTGVQWGKLILNLNNAVNALSGVPLLNQLNDRAYRKIMTQVISEALLVMKKAGIKPARMGKVVPSLMPHILALPNWLFKRVASATLKVDPKARSSMYEDFMLGRKTEIDYLNGEIVSLGEKYSVATPVNNAIVSLVKSAEASASGSPKLSPNQIQAAITKNSL